MERDLTVIVAFTGSTWQLRDVRGCYGMLVANFYGAPRWPCNSYVDPVTATRQPRRIAFRENCAIRGSYMMALRKGVTEALKRPGRPGGGGVTSIRGCIIILYLMREQKKKRGKRLCFQGWAQNARTAKKVSKSRRTGQWYPNCYD